MHTKIARQWAEFLILAGVIVALVFFLRQSGAWKDSVEEEARQAVNLTETEIRSHFMYEGRLYWLSDTLEVTSVLPEGFAEAVTVEQVVEGHAVETGQANGCEEGSVIYANDSAPGVCYLLPLDGTVYFRYDFAG